MTDVKRLLSEATPLPWYFEVEPPGSLIASPARIGAEGHRRAVGDYAFLYFDGETYPEPLSPSANAELIVYAVNHLPDYLAAVEALERSVEALGFVAVHAPWDSIRSDIEPMVATALGEARAALRRLRDKVPV